MATTPDSERLTSTEFTQHTMWSDLTQQRWLMPVGIGIGVLLLVNVMRRPAPQEKAARHLVRDWRNVDDIGDARELIGENVPTIIRPVLLLILEEVERQVRQGFRRVEHTIEHL